LKRVWWASKSHLKRIAGTIRANFAPWYCSTWPWVAIKSFQHFQVSRKGHLYMYL
jgi:hypothetical protein